ncbi:MAG: hypothetical protein ACRD0U_19965, partial [Acidimicrobiales bacterium]
MPTSADATSGVVTRYLDLGLRLGRLLDGLVDAYYGPPPLAQRVEDEPPRPAASLVGDARRLVADLDAGDDDDPPLTAARRAWLRAQAVGLHATARRLAGEDIGYADEVEACYGVRPTRVADYAVSAAHPALDEVLP